MSDDPSLSRRDFFRQMFRQTREQTGDVLREAWQAWDVLQDAFSESDRDRSRDRSVKAVRLNTGIVIRNPSSLCQPLFKALASRIEPLTLIEIEDVRQVYGDRPGEGRTEAKMNELILGVLPVLWAADHFPSLVLIGLLSHDGIQPGWGLFGTQAAVDAHTAALLKCLEQLDDVSRKQMTDTVVDYQPALTVRDELEAYFQQWLPQKPPDSFYYQG